MVEKAVVFKAGCRLEAGGAPEVRGRRSEGGPETGGWRLEAEGAEPEAEVGALLTTDN
jgi:hypothetical protein